MTDGVPPPGARVSSGPLVPTPPRISLSSVAAATERHEVRGDSGITVSEAAYSSDQVVPGAVFFCFAGSRFDGHDFAAAAIQAGAAALIVERWLELDIPQVLVPSVRKAMGPMSAAVFGNPADSMSMIGVTGTNGKTTTTYLLESVFAAAGLVAGVVGTTGARIDGQPMPLARTTPEAPDLHRLLAQMRSRGVQAVAMEVSSHALDQDRVGGVRFDCAVFTNLSQDHLDYHPSMEEYFAAKALLFTPERAERGVVNADDPWALRLRAAPIPVTTFGLTEDADLRGIGPTADAAGVSFMVDGLEVHSPLRGMFNVSNCLAALAVARTLGIGEEIAKAGIESLAGVPGRVEPVDEGQDFLVMVDYAHTPDSIDNVLRATRPLAGGRVIVVFGCGGDRDRSKRPLMGRAAATGADFTVITSDNPRSEDPLSIIADIESGARQGGGDYTVEPDRRAAIRLALGQAGPGDVVVIAGKGHESGQEFADGTVPFDDRVVASEELRALGAGS